MIMYLKYKTRRIGIVVIDLPDWTRKILLLLSNGGRCSQVTLQSYTNLCCEILKWDLMLVVLVGCLQVIVGSGLTVRPKNGKKY
jgi:hypothetical protein